MRVGVMGGTFDPIHIGHLVAASEVAHRFALDRVVFVPTGQPWQKSDRRVSPPEDRYLMTVIATAADERFSVSRVDVDREGPTYTVDTLRELHLEHPQDTLVLVIGADQADTFDQWRESDEIARLAIISVAVRPRADEPAGTVDASRLPGGQWLPISLRLLSVSATDIRARRASGLGIDHLVPASVARYIDQHHLYLPA